ncbi:MAG: molybdate ABC transporter substrate-binding protein [Bermanella sp.]
MTPSILRLLVLAVTFMSAPASSEPLHVAVAANFKATLEVLKVEFEQQTGHRLTIISAGTGHLSNQILHGAPFDIFLAANHQHPRAVYAQLKNTRQLGPSALQTYALGRLALLSAHALPNQTLAHNGRRLQQLLGGQLLARLALANAKLAPYGLAAQQTLQHLQLLDKWQGRLIRGQNVAQVYQFIHSRNVDAGFVAYSMVKQLPGARFIEVPEDYHSPIEQLALRLNHKKVSMDFMHFLASEHAHSIIVQQGYTLPKRAAH